MMKRHFAVVGMVVVLCFCFSQTALGGEKFGLGVNLSYMGVADAGADDAIEFDGTSMIGLNATAYVNKLISLAVDLGYSQVDLDAKGAGAGGVTVSAGELTQTPLLATLRIHLPIFDSVDPYVGGGIGYYFNEFDTSDFAALTGGEIKTDDNFAVHINGGIEMLIGEHLALNLDLKYLWGEADLTNLGSSINITGDDLEMRTFIGGIGLKFYF